MATATRRFKTVDEYIKAYPKPVQQLLATMRKAVADAAPGTVESISYNMPVIKLNKKYLVYYAAHAKHIGFYAMPDAIKAFEKELAKYETSKGTVKFPFDIPLPLTLIKKMVAFRLRQVREAQ
ncbi:MAG: DUF1801 domain-containing protein [Patescibacteria group bacterium]